MEDEKALELYWRITTLERKVMLLTNMLSEFLGDVQIDDDARSHYQRWLARIARDEPDGTE